MRISTLTLLLLLLAACGGGSSGPADPGGGGGGGGGGGPLDEDGAWTWVNPTPFGSPLWRVDFASDDVVYAVGSGATVLKSVDAGVSWEIAVGLYRVIELPTANLDELHFLDEQNGYVVGDQGLVVRTADGGRTWADVSVDTGRDLHDLHFLDIDHGWVAGGRGGLYRTDDGGMSWEEVSHPGGDAGLVAVGFATPSVGWICADGAAVYATEDGGATWSEVLVGFGGAIVVGGVMADGQMAVANSFGGIFPGDTEAFSSAFFAADEILDFEFEDPLNGAVLYVEGGESRVGVRRDGNWSHTALSVPRSVSGLARSGDRLVAVGWQGVITFSHDGGEHWEAGFDELDVDAPSQLLDVCFNTSGVGIAVGSNGTILRSSDGGHSWTPRDSGSSQEFWACWITDGAVGLAVAFDGDAVRSVDGGMTWAPVTLPAGLANSALRDVSMWDDQNGLIVGSTTDNSSLVLVTHDGGLTWTEAAAGDDDTIITVCVYATAGQTAYVGCNPSYVLKTTDGGASWTPLETDLPFAIAQIMFADAEHGWALTQRNRYAWTTDGGTTWTHSDPVGPSFWAMHFADADRGIGVQSTGRVHTTADGGVTWSPSHAGWSTWSHVRSVWMRSATDAVIVGTESKIQITETGGWLPD